MKLQLLAKVLQLDIPFAIIFSNSALGSDVFITITDDHYLNSDLKGFETGDNRRLRSRALASAEINHFLTIKHEFKAVSLGRDGMAYELDGRSLREHWHKLHAAPTPAKPQEVGEPILYTNPKRLKTEEGLLLGYFYSEYKRTTLARIKVNGWTRNVNPDFVRPVRGKTPSSK